MRQRDKQMLKLALKLQRGLRLAITIDVSIHLAGRGVGGGGAAACSRTGIYLFPNFTPLVHEEFGPSFAWMGDLAAWKAKLREVGYDGDADMVVGAVIAPEAVVHLTAVDMHVDCYGAYGAALLIVQSSKPRQYGDLVSRTKLFIKDAQRLCIASHS